MIRKIAARNERGSTIVEFAIAAVMILTVLFGVIEFARLFWTRTALMSAAHRGARYAIVRKNDTAGVDAVKKMTVYGDPAADVSTATPLVPGLTISNVSVDYKNWDGLRLSARANVSITGYQFSFAIPLLGATITMPTYRAALPGESAGFVPCDIPSTTPFAPCAIVPN
ncbi:MAG TPA: TadE/TadG family type IV pilus assembly protein [Blastocatellia bacterium]|nr:TadE/TadG family type IV pilus assembly protein [Blastocatellia bacterium]